MGQSVEDHPLLSWAAAHSGILQETGSSHNGRVASQTWTPASGFTKFRSLESTRGATRRLASTSVGLVGVGVPHPPLQVG